MPHDTRRLEPHVRAYYATALEKGLTTEPLIDIAVGRKPGVLLLLAGVVLLVVPPIGVAILVIYFFALRRFHSRATVLRQTATNGRLRHAYPSRVQKALAHKSRLLGGAGLLALCDEGPELTDEQAENVQYLMLSTSLDPASAAVLEDEECITFRRRILPFVSPNGRVVALFDIIVFAKRTDICDHKVDCYMMIQPGTTGGAFLVPTAVIEYAYQRSKGKMVNAPLEPITAITQQANKHAVAGG